MTRPKVEIGLFAHDEGAGIAAMIARLCAQDIWQAAEVRLLVLANGCSDDTVARARAVAGPGVKVLDLAQGGKSRTWNRFVHDLSARDADVLVFCDADIDLPLPGALRLLVQGLRDRPGLRVLNSEPRKSFGPGGPQGVAQRLISAAGGGLDDWKSAICGQLYAMPTRAARAHHLPIGLPVEDGFLRAMVLTDALTAPEDLSRIDGAEGVFHTYESERHLSALIRHQTRIVIGGAVNFAVFRHLSALPAASRAAELARTAGDDGWLPRILRAQLPRPAFGYVPWHFLVKRAARIRPTPRGLALGALGLGFDALVWVLAQVRMARGAGAGHW